VLVDFGSVRQVFLSADESGSTIAGTYGYMPYKQYMGQATPSSDLFSLGATVLHALTGRPPRGFMDVNGQIALPDAVSVSEPLQRVLARMLNRLVPSMFEYMDTTAKSTDESTIADGFAFVAITVLTFGVYPAVFFAIARSRRRRLRRFLRNGAPALARIHRIDSEETAFRSRVARVHYDFEVNGVLHRDSDQVMPLIAGRWDLNQTVAILYIASVPYDSVIVSEA